jgi:hypothetical protein
MPKYLSLTSMIVVLLIGAFCVNAEKSTELYIPIGQSPGLSGKYTALGKIDHVNVQNQTITMSDPQGTTYTVRLTSRTFIYLDKTKVHLTNTYGTLADCRVGDTLEVKFEDNARSKPVEWIKVEKAH